MTRIYKFADDSMMGREAGTRWSNTGTDYIAAEVARLGLEPAGENGTYFQDALVSRELDPASTVRVGNTQYVAWRDYAPRDQGSGARSFDGVQSVFGGTIEDSTSLIPRGSEAGKVVVVRISATGPLSVSRAAVTNRFVRAAAIVLILPPTLSAAEQTQTGVRPRGANDNFGTLPSYMYVTPAVARSLLGASPDSLRSGFAGGTLHGHIRYSPRPAMGRNVIAILRGSDPALRGQYVAIGAHTDHIGLRGRPIAHDSLKAVMMHAAPQGADDPSPVPTEAEWGAIRVTIDSLRKLNPTRLDSINNGADDDASGSMSVLEIAEAFATSPVKPKRSILFVWHVAEESGLLGAEYFTKNPTVPRDSITAQLNMDMVGRGQATDVPGQTKEGALIRGGPGYLQLIGSRRLSTELGDIIERVNTEKQLGFRFDYSLDANGHPQNIYCRSDHYEYAKFGIPIAFFTTGGHADYHQVTDEPQYLDFGRITSVARLVYETAKTLADAPNRVTVDKPKPDPRGTCRQ